MWFNEASPFVGVEPKDPAGGRAPMTLEKFVAAS
jgi:hypothetical protein